MTDPQIADTDRGIDWSHNCPYCGESDCQDLQHARWVAEYFESVAGAQLDRAEAAESSIARVREIGKEICLIGLPAGMPTKDVEAIERFCKLVAELDSVQPSDPGGETRGDPSAGDIHDLDNLNDPGEER